MHMDFQQIFYTITDSRSTAVSKQTLLICSIFILLLWLKYILLVPENLHVLLSVVFQPFPNLKLCQGHDSNQLSKAKKKEEKRIILYIQFNLCRER